jgi:hypothetical protein
MKQRRKYALSVNERHPVFGYLKMITYQSSNSKSMIALAVVAVGALAGVAYWWSTSGDDSEGVTTSQSAPSAPTMSGSMPNMAEVEEATKPTLNTADVLEAPAKAEDGRPVDVKPEHWAALKSVLAKQGFPPEEAQRLTSYLHYQRSFEKWQQMDEEKDAVKRRLVARALLEELPERLKTGEFAAIEGQMMTAVLMTAMEGTDEERTKQMEQWQAKLGSISNPLEPEQLQLKKARDVRYKRQLADAFSECENAANCTEAQLSQAFEQARRDYNAGTN